ncbi:MAG TPA: CBS domain-containing protein [Patescibacteria group bacterium]
MQIKDIMTKGVITVEKETSVSDVARIMREHKIHGIPVVEGKHVVGIITETDFFVKGETEIHLPSYVDFLTKTGIAHDQKSEEKEEFNEILQAKAGDIMTEDCVTIEPEADVKDFLKIVKEKDLHTVPVAVGDILMGVVTVADVIKLL